MLKKTSSIVLAAVALNAASSLAAPISEDLYVYGSLEARGSEHHRNHHHAGAHTSKVPTTSAPQATGSAVASSAATPLPSSADIKAQYVKRTHNAEHSGNKKNGRHHSAVKSASTSPSATSSVPGAMPSAAQGQQLQPAPRAKRSLRARKVSNGDAQAPPSKRSPRIKLKHVATGLEAGANAAGAAASITDMTQQLQQPPSRRRLRRNRHVPSTKNNHIPPQKTTTFKATPKKVSPAKPEPEREPPMSAQEKMGLAVDGIGAISNTALTADQIASNHIPQQSGLPPSQDPSSTGQMPTDGSNMQTQAVRSFDEYKLEDRDVAEYLLEDLD